MFTNEKNTATITESTKMVITSVGEYIGKMKEYNQPTLMQIILGLLTK